MILRLDRRRLLAGFATLLIGCVPLLATDYYVAPTGSAGGNGSITSPWDLQTALSQPASVHPGDTIWLRGGTYTGTFVSRLTGAAGNPIIVRQYPGERATLDAATPNALVGNSNIHSLNVQGAYAWYWGFEIMNSNTIRQTQTVYNNFRGDGLWITGPNTKFINLSVHDTDQGFSFWEGAVDSELYGNLIYNNGWSDPLRGRGHNIYAQNQFGTKLISDNIIFQAFDHGIQVYGSDQAHLDNFVLEGNISAVNGSQNYLIGGQGSRPALNPVLNSNYSYGRVGSTDGGDVNNLGYQATAGCANPIVTNNYFGYGGLRFVSCTNITMTGNTFYGVTDFYGSNLGLGPSDFPNNVYYGVTRPTGVKVFVRPNKYETGRANIAVFNWDFDSTVTADISGIGLQVGERFELHNAQDYYGDVAFGIWNGGLLQIPMIGHSAAPFVGWSTPSPTFPEFGMFVIQKATNATEPLQVFAPEISPPGGPFTGAVTVTLSTKTLGAEIRYTTDGSTPGPASQRYTGPISVSSNTTIQAQTFVAGASPSGVATAVFTRNPAGIWPDTATPVYTFANDARGVELGVRFRSDNDGYITGVRFYKSWLNLGPHTGQLYSNAGVLLAEGVFSNETGSGWQQLNFAAPVPITANTTYVAAYFTPSGFYSYDVNYFSARGVDSPPLHALQSGLDGYSGVYNYTTTPRFPLQTYNGTNYWVDVVFSNDPSAPTLASITPASGLVGTTVPVTLTGTNLTGALLNLSAGLTANDVTVDATHITANLVIPASAAIGPRAITVTTSRRTSNVVVFTINRRRRSR